MPDNSFITCHLHFQHKGKKVKTEHIKGKVGNIPVYKTGSKNGEIFLPVNKIIWIEHPFIRPERIPEGYPAKPDSGNKDEAGNGSCNKSVNNFHWGKGR